MPIEQLLHARDKDLGGRFKVRRLLPTFPRLGVGPFVFFDHFGPYEPGKERLMACRKAGAKILPTNEAMAQALQSEEIAICIMWKARAVQWQKAGAKVETVAPKEGIPLYISGFVIPKNAPNKDGAHVWLNEMLQPSAQEAFAEDMGYNPSASNAKIPPETERRIGFNADERKRLIDLDYGYLAKNDAALKEWWDKTFKG